MPVKRDGVLSFVAKVGATATAVIGCGTILTVLGTVALRYTQEPIIKRLEVTETTLKNESAFIYLNTRRLDAIATLMVSDTSSSQYKAALLELDELRKMRQQLGMDWFKKEDYK